MFNVMLVRAFFSCVASSGSFRSSSTTIRTNLRTEGSGRGSGSGSACGSVPHYAFASAFASAFAFAFAFAFGSPATQRRRLARVFNCRGRIFLDTACARRGWGSPSARHALGERERVMLRIHEVAVELVREVMPLLKQIERHDGDLARQGRKAVTSTAQNIAEGSDQSGKRRGFHYRISLGSARETWSVLRCAEAAGYIAMPPPEMKNKFDHVIGTLHRCVIPRTA
jgi:four helix bundle protein